LDGAYGTSPPAPVDRLRRSRSTSLEQTPCSLPFSNIDISPPKTTRRLARVPAELRPNAQQVGSDPVRSFGKPPDLGYLFVTH
jgi:hypothetical protein